MRRFLALIVAAIALTGCATSIMRSYVGQTPEQVMLDYGPPANVFDLPDGSRAFQWMMSSTTYMPMTAHTTTYGYGSAAFSNTTITGGQPITADCVYTMLARWDAARNAWVFYDFRRPTMMCS